MGEHIENPMAYKKCALKIYALLTHVSHNNTMTSRTPTKISDWCCIPHFYLMKDQSNCDKYLFVSGSLKNLSGMWDKFYGN